MLAAAAATANTAADSDADVSAAPCNTASSSARRRWRDALSHRDAKVTPRFSRSPSSERKEADSSNSIGSPSPLGVGKIAVGLEEGASAQSFAL
jgi:hypothetical protein